MYATDFEYDGQRLSDYRCMICSFDDISGTQIASAGSSITFNKISKNYGKSFLLSGHQYDQCITATFDICKDPYKSNNPHFTHDECRDLMRWLNRSEFLSFRIIYDGEYDGLFFFNASFNVEKIKVADKVCGFRLTMETDKPYAYGALQETILTLSDTNATKNKYVLTNFSDELGELYPTIEIQLYSEGTLTIVNETLQETTIIKNCQSGETIKIDGDILQISSSTDRNILDAFNYVFPKLNNEISDRRNIYTFSLPCRVYVAYYPIVKDTI